MREIAEFEFDYKLSEHEQSSYKIPTRWFKEDSRYSTIDYVNKVEGKSFDEKCRFVLESIEHDSFGYVDMIHSFYLEEKDKSDFKYDCLAKLVYAKQCKNNKFSFSYDGSTSLYDLIFPAMRQSERESIKKELFNHYDFNQKSSFSEYSLIYNLNEDFGSWLLWLGKVEESEKRSFAFQQLLDMHFKWITAKGRIQFRAKYNEHINSVEGTWTDVCALLSQIADSTNSR